MGKMGRSVFGLVMTTKELEAWCMYWLDPRKNYVVNNVTNVSNLVDFESDIVCLSKDGYANIYELKISLSDFRVDSKKPHVFRYDSSDENTFSKRAKTFNYVVPDYISKYVLEHTNFDFGVIEAKKHPDMTITFRILRSPKQFPSDKWEHKQIMKLLHLGTMRIASLKLRQLTKLRQKDVEKKL